VAGSGPSWQRTGSTRRASHPRWKRGPQQHVGLGGGGQVVAVGERVAQALAAAVHVVAVGALQ